MIFICASGLILFSLYFGLALTKSTIAFFYYVCLLLEAMHLDPNSATLTLLSTGSCFFVCFVCAFLHSILQQILNYNIYLLLL